MSNGELSDGLFATVRQNRKPSGRGAAPGCLAVDDGGKFPLLLSLLASLPKGAVKGAKCGRVGFYQYNGRLSVAINVPSMKTCGFLTLERLEDAFEVIERALELGKVDWRED